MVSCASQKMRCFLIGQKIKKGGEWRERESGRGRERELADQKVEMAKGRSYRCENKSEFFHTFGRNDKG